jgi:hypothetical protein
MKKIGVILFLFIIACKSAFGQLDSVYKISEENNRIVYNNVIKLFPGQKCLIIPTVTSGIIEKFELFTNEKSDLNSRSDINKRVLEIYQKKIVKENQLYIEFNIINENGMNSFLLVNNPFKINLIYKAKIYSKKTKAYEETSIIPILSGITGVEHWPYKIDEIILYDFELKND